MTEPRHPALEVKGLRFSYGGGRSVVDGVSFDIRAGEMVGIIGPNGSGKTTLLKLLSRVLAPAGGSAAVLGRDIAAYERRELSRVMSVVPQQAEIPFSYTVEDVVAMGRFPYQRRLAAAASDDTEMVRRSLVMTDTMSYRERFVQELSGGERQRVIIARALAADPEIMLLDEPTSFLDINHQMEIFELIERMNEGRGMTVVIVSHDINLAAEYCHRLILMKDGQVAAAGTPGEVLTAERVGGAFGCEVTVDTSRFSGVPWVYYARSGSRVKKRERVLVVGGGGSAAGVLRKLYFNGYGVTAGVLNRGDTDEVTAGGLGIDCIRIDPFAPVTAQAAGAAEEMLGQTDMAVLACTSWGNGNLPNLELVCRAAAEGVPVWIPDGGGSSDFTDGQRAGALLDDLKNNGNVHTWSGEADLLRQLEAADTGWKADRTPGTGKD